MIQSKQRVWSTTAELPNLICELRSPASLPFSRRPIGLSALSLTANPPNWIQTDLATKQVTKPVAWLNHALAKRFPFRTLISSCNMAYFLGLPQYFYIILNSVLNFFFLPKCSTHCFFCFQLTGNHPLQRIIVLWWRLSLIGAPGWMSKVPKRCRWSQTTSNLRRRILIPVGIFRVFRLFFPLSLK